MKNVYKKKIKQLFKKKKITYKRLRRIRVLKKQSVERRKRPLRTYKVVGTESSYGDTPIKTDFFETRSRKEAKQEFQDKYSLVAPFQPYVKSVEIAKTKHVSHALNKK